MVDRRLFDAIFSAVNQRKLLSAQEGRGEVFWDGFDLSSYVMKLFIPFLKALRIDLLTFCIYQYNRVEPCE